MKLGRLGVWYSSDKHKDAAAISAFAKTVERLGYDTLWYPEARGYEIVHRRRLHALTDLDAENR